MRKTLAVISTALLMVISAPALQADAAVVKTTVTVTAPKYVFAGAPNPIDVAVCQKASLSATTCENGNNRQVTLWANGVKVQTLSTISGGGAAVFTWTPRSSGSVTLKASVSASGSTRSASSEPKKITVKAKTKASSLGTRSCGTVCVQGIPATLNLNITSQVITAGVTSGSPKSRKVRFQTLRVDNKYEDQYSATSSWQSDINKYGIALTFAQIDSFSACSPGETLTWNFRFYLDPTSTSPAAATKATWIDVVCPDSGASDDPIEMEVFYSSREVNYDDFYPDDIEVSIYAPSTTQYSIGSFYCLKDYDCSIDESWEVMDYYSKEDNIFGSQDFNLKADPGDYGDYWFRVEVIPWTDQDIMVSEWYSVSLVPAY